MPVFTTDHTNITEFTEIDADRVDLVKTPANGFPFLMIKAIDEPDCGPDCDRTYHDGHRAGWAAGYDRGNADKAVARGKRDEAPDIEGAQAVLDLLGKLVASEASELAAGYSAETCDIKLLLEAISLMEWFKCNEQMAAEMDAAAVKAAGDDPAAIVAAVKRLADSFKEPTVADNATKTEAKPDEVEPDSSIVGDVTSEGDKPPADVEAAKALDAKIEDAVAKALKPIEDRAAAAEAEAEAAKAELAKVLATPLPGGPAVTAPAGARAATARNELMAKAAEFDNLADRITEQDMKTFYKAEAERVRAAAAAV